MHQKPRLSPKVVILAIIVVLVGILIAQITNYIQNRQLTTRSRAAELPTPTPAVPQTVFQCGVKKINCNNLKSTSGLVPTGYNMICTPTLDLKDAQCSYALKSGETACSTQGRVAFTTLTTVPADTSSHCLTVAKRFNTTLCIVNELLPQPTTLTACQAFLITPTVSSQKMMPQ